MKKYLGMELGSTRIKAVLINEGNAAVASGTYDWENTRQGRYWTYGIPEIWAGLQSAYAKLAEEYQRIYGEALTAVDGIGISAMMHGYLAFDKDDNLLVPFRTWRNTTTFRAAAILTEYFGFNIPQRWSIAHLYQAILSYEPHVKDVAYMTTLAGYIHWQLTGERVIGVGDASGMFPIDSSSNAYNETMMECFKRVAGIDLYALFPRVLTAGDDAGNLTAKGAKLLDPSGKLQPGVPVCPPEGDAGTGMVATHSIAAHTGNVSAGTSVFAMIVLEKPLSRRYREIDMVTTPAGLPVAMVHCNSCTSDLDAWVKLFGEAAALMGADFTKSGLYDALYAQALEGEPDAGGLLNFNYVAGEPIAGFESGRPLFARLPESRMNLANFMRAQLFSAIATLALGMDVLMEKERVKLDMLLGHGGFFKTPGVGQKLMASALRVPVAVRESAAEGGAWGAALLAAYRVQSVAYREQANELSLETFLDQVFAHTKYVRIEPDERDAEGFEAFKKRYVEGMLIEREAIENLV
ncbi:MAG: ATPase [Peptococcaceae bacterium]|nr:ATPase [Peptococcaceae bacterium]